MSTSIGNQTKNEIIALLGEFRNRKSRKLNKYNFYVKCEEKFLSIEEQIKVKQSLEQSRLKLEQFNEIGTETLSQEKVQEEFELYSYYGNLLDSISLNMKRLEQD